MRPNSPSNVFDRIVINKNGCWLWQGNIAPNGYGLMRLRGAYMGAHRIAYEASKGILPTGFQIDHLCRIRHCVNPEHLEAVMPRENIARAYAARISCRNEHELNGARICQSCVKDKSRRSRNSQKHKEWLIKNSDKIKKYLADYRLKQKSKETLTNA